LPSKPSCSPEGAGGLREINHQPVAFNLEVHRLPVALRQGLEVVLAELEEGLGRLAPQVGGWVEHEAVIPVADVELHALMVAERA